MTTIQADTTYTHVVVAHRHIHTNTQAHIYIYIYIILYNILKISELYCCQIIILSIYVPSTHAYTHVLRLSLDLPYEKRLHYDY